MILKIRRSYGESYAGIPEKVVECDEYDRRAYSEIDSKAENAESIFCDEKGEVKPTTTLTIFRKKKFAGMYILGHAYVFVMNNEGKTIDTITA